jgi:hypothetical protein
VSVVEGWSSLAPPIGARSRVPNAPAGIEGRVARVESEVMAAALIVLWLALEVAWRWRRLRSRLE